MQFFVLNQEPIAEHQTARIDVLKAEGTKYGEALRCEACGKYVGLRQWLPPYRVELETWGHEFADIGIVGTDLLVSLHFKEAWEQSRLIGLNGFESVEVVKLKRHCKAIGDLPPYFRVIVSRSSTAVNLSASEFEWGKRPICPMCRLGDVIKRWKRIIIDQSTWTGEDVLIARGLPGEIIVSQRFKDFWERNELKSAIMSAAETHGHDFYPLEQETPSAPDVGGV